MSINRPSPLGGPAAVPAIKPAAARRTAQPDSLLDPLETAARELSAELKLIFAAPAVREQLIENLRERAAAGSLLAMPEQIGRAMIAPPDWSRR